jgi:hypothetical protein
MLTRQVFFRQQRISLAIALLTFLALPCYRALGASFFLANSKTLDLIEVSRESEIWLQGEELLPQESEREIAVFESPTDTLATLVAANFDRARQTRTESQLSLGYILSAITQLGGLAENQSRDRISNVQTLPQASYADIEIGVYAFKSPLSSRSRLSDRSLSAASLIYPIIPLKKNHSLSATTNTLSAPNSFGSLNVNSNYVSQPKLGGNPQTSYLLPNNLAKTSTTRSQVWERANQQAQKQYSQQQARQQQFQQKILEAQKRQQQTAQQQIHRQQEQTQKQLEHYLQRQKRMQAEYEKRIQEQNKKYQNLR